METGSLQRRLNKTLKVIANNVFKTKS